MRNWMIAMVGLSLLAAGCRHVSGKCDCSAGPSDAHVLTGPTNYQYAQPNAAGALHPSHVGAPSQQGGISGGSTHPAAVGGHTAPVGSAMPMPTGR